MENEQLVTVIIPTYKRPKTLGRAIDSVLNQTYDNIELIVVDDNDENSEYRRETEQFMKNYANNKKVRYLKHKVNKNGAAARNTGIHNSKGDYIALLDDDDEFLPRKIELQVSKLKNLDEEWGGIYCGFIRKQKNIVSLEREEIKAGNLKEELLLNDITLHAGSTLLLRRSVILELNGFDESFIRHQDLELLIRFFRRYKLAAINKKLSVIHKKQGSSPDAKSLESVKNKYLDKFSSDIKDLPKETQRKIYMKHFLPISKAYLRQGDLQNGIRYYKKANSHASIGNKEKLFLIVNFIDRFISVRERLLIIYNKILSQGR